MPTLDCPSCKNSRQKKAEVLKKMDLVDEVKFAEPEKFHETTKVLPRRDSLRKLSSEQVPIWVLDKMVKFQGDPAIVEKGIHIVYDDEAHALCPPEGKKLPQRISKWFLGYCGPHWTEIYGYLSFVYGKCQRDMLPVLCEATMKNINKAIQAGRTIPSIWLFSWMWEDGAIPKWDSEAGVRCLTTAFAFIQEKPYETAESGIHQILDLTTKLYESKAINFDQRYWTSAGFALAIKNFLPTILNSIFAPGHSRNSQKSIAVTIIHFTVMIIEMADSTEFLSAFRSMNFLEAIDKALSILELSPQWRAKVDVETNQLILMTCLMLFCTLAKVNSPEYTEKALKLLEKRVEQAQYKNFSTSWLGVGLGNGDGFSISQQLQRAGMNVKLREFVRQTKQTTMAMAIAPKGIVNAIKIAEYVAEKLETEPNSREDIVDSRI